MSSSSAVSSVAVVASSSSASSSSSSSSSVSSASSSASSTTSSSTPSSTSVVVVVHHAGHPIGGQHNRSEGVGANRTIASTAVDVDHHPLTPLVPAVIGVVLVAIIFMSIAGNLLVCIAISTDRNLRKLSNLFLVSLAVADLFVATLVMTFALTNDLIGHWIFGDGFCNVWIAFDVMGSTSSILNLCAISLDRYLHIRDPLRYSRWMTKSVVLAFIAAIWLTSCLVSFLPISQGLHLPPEDERNGDGDIDDVDDPIAANRTWIAGAAAAAAAAAAAGPPTCAMDLSPTYAVVSSSISFFLPCCVMVAFYTRLYMYARMHVRNIKAMTRPLTQLTHDDDVAAAGGGRDGRIDPDRHDPAQIGSGSMNAHQQHQHQHQHHHSHHHHSQQPAQVSEHKAAVTLGIIMGTFLICWVPFFIINITAAFCKTCISQLCFKILTWLGYANSALNPIIYSIFNQEFRRAFARTLTLYGHRCFCLCYCLWRSDRNGSGTGNGGGGGDFCSNGRQKSTSSEGQHDRRHHRSSGGSQQQQQQQQQQRHRRHQHHHHQIVVRKGVVVVGGGGGGDDDDDNNGVDTATAALTGNDHGKDDRNDDDGVGSGTAIEHRKMSKRNRTPPPPPMTATKTTTTVRAHAQSNGRIGLSDVKDSSV